MTTQQKFGRVFMPFSFMLRRVADLGAMLVLMTTGHGGGAGWRGGQGGVVLAPLSPPFSSIRVEVSSFGISWTCVIQEVILPQLIWLFVFHTIGKLPFLTIHFLSRLLLVDEL